MKRMERCLWCWGITLALIVVSLFGLLAVSQLDVTEHWVASKVFSNWVIMGHPEKSILVWDKIQGWFPVNYRVIGSRWRSQTCLDSGKTDCEVVFAPVIDVSLHPLTFITTGKMDLQMVTMPVVAITMNSTSEGQEADQPAHTRLTRALLQVENTWPSFSHEAVFHTFRIERLSIIAPHDMNLAMTDLLAHPRSMPRIHQGTHDIMVYGSAYIAADGGDWSIAATAYTINSEGDFKGGHHASGQVRGYGDTQYVKGSVDVTYAHTNKLHVNGGTDWAALFGQSGTGDISFTLDSDAAGHAEGRIGLDPLAWCNMTIRDIHVQGHLGPLYDHHTWPQDMRVTHPQGKIQCGSDSCLLSTHGIEVILRPLETGVLVQHSLANTSVATCGGNHNASTWYAAITSTDTSNLCGNIQSVVGDGSFHLDHGKLVSAQLHGSRSPVEYGLWKAQLVDLTANLSSIDLSMHAVSYQKHHGPELIELHVTPDANWTLTSSSGDFLEGWVAPHKLHIERGFVFGYQTIGEAHSTKDRGDVWITATNDASWAEFRVDLDWTQSSWWNRLSHYTATAHLENGIQLFGIQVRGIVDVIMRGGGPVMPYANITLTGGSVLRMETGHQVSNTTGIVHLPSGLYNVEGRYSSLSTEAYFTSEGTLVLSPSSIEGESYTRYRTELGGWDRIDSWFEWEWRSE